MADLLSRQINEVREWAAQYVHDGAKLAPDSFASLTELFSDLQRKAEELEVEVERAKLGEAAACVERAAMNLAVVMTGAHYVPKLTEAHLQDPKIALFPVAPRRPSADGAQHG